MHFWKQGACNGGINLYRQATFPFHTPFGYIFIITFSYPEARDDPKNLSHPNRQQVETRRALPSPPGPRKGPNQGQEWERIVRESCWLRQGLFGTGGLAGGGPRLDHAGMREEGWRNGDQDARPLGQDAGTPAGLEMGGGARTNPGKLTFLLR